MNSTFVSMLPTSMIRRLSSRARWFVLVLLGAAAMLSTTSGAGAQVLVTFASFDGNTSTQTDTVGITPSAGTQQFLATTINPVGAVPTGYGTAAADTDVTNLNVFFGLPNGTLNGLNAKSGSGFLSEKLRLSAGTVVHFDYVFLTDEDNSLTGTSFHDDQTFFTINGAINATLYQASQLSSAQLDNGSNTIFSFQTPGYVTVDYTVPTTTDYTFGFGVIDVGTTTIKSGLLVDNFNYTPIPEPGTGALLLCLGGVVAVCCRLARTRVIQAPADPSPAVTRLS